MGSLRVRSRAKRKGLNRRARAKLWRSTALHFAAAKGFGDIAAADESATAEEAQSRAGSALAGLWRAIAQGLRRESAVNAVYHLGSGIGAIVAARLVGRRPKAPMWWGGNDV